MMSGKPSNNYGQLFLAILGRSSEAIRGLAASGRFDASFAAALATGIVSGLLSAINMLTWVFPVPWYAYVEAPGNLYPPPYDYTIYYLQQVLVGNAVSILLQWLLLSLATVILGMLFFKSEIGGKASRLFSVSGFALIPLATMPAVELLSRYQYGFSPIGLLLGLTAKLLIVFYVIALWVLIIRVVFDFQNGQEFILALPPILYYLLSLLPGPPSVPVPVQLPGGEGTLPPSRAIGEIQSYGLSPELILMLAIVIVAFTFLNYYSKRSPKPPTTKATS